MSTAALRVATRYLIAYLAPKEMLRTYEQYKSRIMPIVRDESRAPEAKALYLEMAEKFRPTALALEGAVIQRPDEARKLKNLQGWLKTLKSRTRPDMFDGSDGFRDDMIRITMSLDYLGDTLKSLARVQDRLQDYQQIERKIQHGPWTVLNSFGYRPDEYAEPLSALDKAGEYVQKAGFGDALYGIVVLESVKGHFSGMYIDGLDQIRLNVTAKKRYDDIYTLVHEIGHRVWHKVVSSTQRTAYEDAYMGSGRPITVPERESFWAALEKTDYKPQAAQRLLPDDLQPIFMAYWKETMRGALLPTPKLVQTMGRESFYNPFVRPRQRYYVLDTHRPQSVTDYGQTNVKEDFAEVFAHYCMGKPLTPDAAERFRAATGKG